MIKIGRYFLAQEAISVGHNCARHN